MGHEDSRLTGIIDNADMVFYKRGYQFTFLPPTLQKEGYTLPANDSFTFGASHSGKRIAIFTGENGLLAYHSVSYVAPLYVVSGMSKPDLDISRYYRIFFIGGVLNDLFEARSLVENIENDNKIFIARQTCKSNYSFSTSEYTCQIEIGLSGVDTFDHHSFSYNDTAYLIMEFDKPQLLSSLQHHYKKVNQVISFMTHRRENRIGEIRIDTSLNPEARYIGRCDVHIRDNDMAKDHRNIVVTFDSLGEGFANLLRIVYNSKENSPSYSLGFIPRNDEGSRIITDDTVRAVTAALECEIQAYSELQTNTSSELDTLCKMVKDLVSEHRKQHRDKPVITDETYNLIFNSIGHWTKAASELIIALFHKFESEMGTHLQGEAQVSEDDIRALVKYRNSISHGNYREMTPQIRKTVIAMKILVYFSLLKRAGVVLEKPEEFAAFAVIL